jgi:integrase/recombinase XerD
MANVRIIINKSKVDQSGLCPLKIRVSCNGNRKEAYFPNIKVNPKFWNPKKQLVTNDKMLSLRIQNAVSDIQTEINRCYALNKDILAIDLLDTINENKKSVVSNTKYDTVLFITENFVNNLNLAYSTRKGYKTLCNVIQKYDSEVSISEISLDWVAKFKIYLAKEYKLSGTSIWTRIKNIKATIRLAYEKGVISQYTLEGLKMPRNKSKRNYLSMEQITQLKRYEPPENLKNTYNGFMFSIYCGLRISDITTITQKNIIYKTIGGIKEYRLNLNMRKTKSDLDFTLNQSSLKYITIRPQNVNEPLFSFLKESDLQLPSDILAQKIESVTALANKRLKQILTLAGLPKEYSFHCARHTFATTAIQLGVDVMSLRDLLGQKDIVVTQEYLNVVDSQKRNAMLKFDTI